MIGPHADLFTPGGYSGKADNPVNPLQGIKNRVASGHGNPVRPGVRDRQAYGVARAAGSQSACQ